MKGSVRFGNKITDRKMHFDPVTAELAANRKHAFARIQDCLDVFHRLARKSDHVIELERKPTVLKDRSDSFFEHFVIKGFIDDRLQARGGSFGRERKATSRAQVAQLVHQFN